MEKEIDINNEEQILKEFNFDYCYNSEKCSRELIAFYNDLIGLSDSKNFMYNQAKIDLGRIAITLNKQSARIKELEKENKFLEKRNEELTINCRDFCLERNDLFEENQQLKQSQNSKAIEELEKVKRYFDDNDPNDKSDGWIITNRDVVDYVDNQIKELSGE